MYDGKKNIQGNHTAADRPLGQLLVDGEVIIPHDLEFALEHQQYSNEPLGQILVRMGALNTEDLEKVMTIWSRNASS
jgi:hypothetical protein